MKEIVPGLFHWTARHPRIGLKVSSYLVADSGAVIDPLLPAGEGPDWLGQGVEHVVVTICLHTRSAPDFGLPIHAPRAGLYRWEGRDIDAAPYDDGDEVAPGMRAHALAAIAPDDYVLHIDAGDGVLAIGDGLVNYGGIGFVPDGLMGDDPAGVKRATRERVRSLLELDFDALTFAHGEPIPSGGKAALRAFAE